MLYPYASDWIAARGHGRGENEGCGKEFWRAKGKPFVRQQFHSGSPCFDVRLQSC
jgi:hypothetical protein